MLSALSRDSFKKAIREYPRCPLAHLPTPLKLMPKLSRELGFNLFIKRDDQTGLAFGGNKVRKLEYLMSDIVSQKADCVITWAGVQSNWCRQLAAAARMVGVLPVLLLFKRQGLPGDFDGNLLLDVLLGAEIHIRNLDPNRNMMALSGVHDLIEELADIHRKAGRKPYIAPIGASLLGGSMQKPLGSLGYVNAVAELLEQTEPMGIGVNHIVLATGSGGMHAGLVVGAKLFAPEMNIVGISVSEEAATISEWTEIISRQTLDELVPGSNITIEEEDITVFDDFMGRGYGQLDEATTKCMRRVAQEEGILLDPVYTGRAMLGLFELARKGYFKQGENVVFIHSGGTPAIFPYRAELLNTLFKSGKAATL